MGLCLQKQTVEYSGSVVAGADCISVFLPNRKRTMRVRMLKEEEK
jgi:hypothetical protein